MAEYIEKQAATTIPVLPKVWFFIEEDESENTTIKKWNRRAGEDG